MRTIFLAMTDEASPSYAPVLATPVTSTTVSIERVHPDFSDAAPELSSGDPGSSCRMIRLRGPGEAQPRQRMIAVERIGLTGAARAGGDCLRGRRWPRSPARRGGSIGGARGAAAEVAARRLAIGVAVLEAPPALAVAGHPRSGTNSRAVPWRSRSRRRGRRRRPYTASVSLLSIPRPCSRSGSRDRTAAPSAAQEAVVRARRARQPLRPARRLGVGRPEMAVGVAVVRSAPPAAAEAVADDGGAVEGCGRSRAAPARRPGRSGRTARRSPNPPSPGRRPITRAAGRTPPQTNARPMPGQRRGVSPGSPSRASAPRARLAYRRRGLGRPGRAAATRSQAVERPPASPPRSRSDRS